MSMPINNKFGVLLAEKRIREKRKVSLTEVHEATGVARPTLQAWENNTVTRFDTNVVDALCQYFGVGLSELLEYVPPADRPQPKKKTAHK
jgi:putative transcriptional regulator